MYFYLMAQNTRKEKSLEWGCRIILTFHFLTVLSGYINYLETKYQLASPVIPTRLIEQMSTLYWRISLVQGVVFMVCLWFYFFRLRMITIIVSTIAVIAYAIVVKSFLDSIQ
jgi:hypothetical protein